VWLSPGNHHNKDRAFLFPVYVMPWIKMATTEKKWLPEAITPWKRQNSIGEFLCTIHKYGILNGVKWNSLVYMYITLCVLRWWIGGVFFIEVVRVIIHKAWPWTIVGNSSYFSTQSLSQLAHPSPFSI
jgi:hypothetical protein